MLFCQLAHADSLREICNGLACCLGELVHLGIGVAPNKSTLAYANKHRPAALYEDLFYTALERFHRDEKGLGLRKQRFRFKNKLLSLDSTVSVCLGMFPWAKFRPAKGGVKAHVLLDHDDYLPGYVLITEARRSDVKMANAFPLIPVPSWRWIVAITITHCSASNWTDQKIYFVTRLKDNAAYEVLEEGLVPANRDIRADQLIRFTGEKAQRDCPSLLRRVAVWDALNEREIVLLTNLIMGSTTIAAIYKDRWEIELFFKALKQNLKVKTFVGTSENAFVFQISTALIAILLLKWLHHLSKAKWSLSNLASMLRLNLFTYRDLIAWLDNPFGTPPLLPESQQLTLWLT